RGTRWTYCHHRQERSFRNGRKYRTVTSILYVARLRRSQIHFNRTCKGSRSKSHLYRDRGAVSPHWNGVSPDTFSPSCSFGSRRPIREYKHALQSFVARDGTRATTLSCARHG